MDSKALQIVNQKNKLATMKQRVRTGEGFAHPHDKINYSLSIIIEQAKLGQLVTAKN